ncbi:Mannose-6-phosphate isomerase [Rhizina undulata]
MVLGVPLYRLQCGANSYDWGKTGHASTVARFASATVESKFTIQADKPYAELWMGTHPSNPSIDIATNRTLQNLIEDNQALLSSSIVEAYGQKLPFLFKVLSIQKALSIQAHPHKELAERLHAADPKNYPDDNHKPEMTIALTPFTGFCGFRPLNQIATFLSEVPPLRSLVGESAASSFIHAVTGNESSTVPSTVSANREALKALYSALMTQPESRISSLAADLIQLAKSSPEIFGKGDDGKELAALLIGLDKEFSGDVGLFCTFFLNFVKLEPGEAMFLSANMPHAYLSGDVIECMATSDNVVRAGFTPKFKDVPNLIEMLTYSYAPIEEQKMKPVPYPKASGASSSNPTSLLYDPPIPEFAVVKTTLPPGGSETFEGIEGPSIVIATKGSGSIAVGPKKDSVREGWVWFVGATAEVVIEAGEEELQVFRAFCEA